MKSAPTGDNTTYTDGVLEQSPTLCKANSRSPTVLCHSSGPMQEHGSNDKVVDVRSEQRYLADRQTRGHVPVDQGVKGPKPEVSNGSGIVKPA